MKSRLTILGALWVPAMAMAAPPNMQAGLWEITTRMEMPGMPMQMPPQTIRHCYKKEDLKDSKDALPADKSCKLEDLKESGNTVRWKVACKTENGPMNGTGEVTYAGQSYSGTMTMTGKMDGQALNMTNKYSAKRLGDCK